MEKKYIRKLRQLENKELKSSPRPDDVVPQKTRCVLSPQWVMFGGGITVCTQTDCSTHSPSFSIAQHSLLFSERAQWESTAVASKCSRKKNSHCSLCEVVKLPQSDMMRLWVLGRRELCDRVCVTGVLEPQSPWKFLYIKCARHLGCPWTQWVKGATCVFICCQLAVSWHLYGELRL